MIAIKINAVGRGVIEDSIEDQMHAALIDGRDERLKRGIAAERRINVQVIVRVVAMIRARGEDRIQIDRVNAEALQVVEFLFDAFQITAVELRAVSAVERAGL